MTPNATRAGLGGVGGGTGIVAIAEAIGPHTVIGTILLYLAPAISFGAGSFLYYLEIQASHYLQNRVIANARKTLEGLLDNTRTSNAHKQRIRKLLEELEEAVAANELERVRVVAVSLSPSPDARLGGAEAQVNEKSAI
jgi:hypothetical protein